MSDVVYVVVEDDGDSGYSDHSVIGVFTDVEDARTLAEKSYDREIETWSTGSDSHRVEKTLHLARHEMANPQFRDPAELVWKTRYLTQDVDASRLKESSDFDYNWGLQRGGWTAEEASLRLNEALDDFKPDLTPLPEVYCYRQPRVWRYHEHFATVAP
ncbi:hypothetical protein ACH47B_13275 [Rhodococcus sp. NPDC019627]|uniref:hypothetical protein n=1 Tax=unclassified Rhodococcus (in: high G+C Gram-positive bacteria) TaxID=192944 RepID=UPI0034046E28